MSGAADIDGYVAALQPLRAERVGMVVAVVRRIAPEAAQAIEYRMPTFRHGDRFFAVASQKHYVSLYLGCIPALCAEVLESDPRLKGGKGCVNVRDTVPLPIEALERALAKLFTA